MAGHPVPARQRNLARSFAGGIVIWNPVSTPGETSSALAAGAAPQAGAFVATHWSVVITAARQDTTRAEAALEELCRAYWQPLFYYVRRRGYGEEAARDLTQSFFARLLERQWLASAEKEKGRFRTFLLTAMERFLANEWHRERALKRGGGRPDVPIQCDTTGLRYGVDPPDLRTPEQDFEYRWAVVLLEQVLQRLQSEYENRRQGTLFAALKSCLVGERRGQPYAALAVELGMGETAVKVAVHRLRKRYRELLRAEIAGTVPNEQEVDEEMHYLFGVLARGR
jgi:DNA-directed RNA polymerase specialized sigma24 family protein